MSERIRKLQDAQKKVADCHAAAAELDRAYADFSPDGKASMQQRSRAQMALEALHRTVTPLQSAHDAARQASVDAERHDPVALAASAGTGRTETRDVAAINRYRSTAGLAPLPADASEAVLTASDATSPEFEAHKKIRELAGLPKITFENFQARRKLN